MKIKIDVQALQERLKAEEEQAKNGKKYEDKPSDFLKAEAAGTVNFRATYYPHNEDPSRNPFLERYYHYNIDGTFGAVYCPKENDGEECHLCNFLWDQVKKYKGQEINKKWRDKLPRKNIIIPGLVRGKEEEGPKFLRFGTRKDKMSENHTTVYGWFFDSDTSDWLDADNGFDIKLKYEELDEARSKFFGGAKFELKNLELARKKSPFGKKGEFEEFLEKVKNVDKDIYPRRTTAETLEMLDKMRSKLSSKESDEMTFPPKDAVNTESEQEKLAKALDSLGN